MHLLAWLVLVAAACTADSKPVDPGPAEPGPTEQPDPGSVPGGGGSCEGEQDPGRVTLHRLNRTEYNNTARDLLGTELSPADDFPADDFGFGFDNNADVLAISPLLFEKYDLAAQALAEEIVQPPFSGPRLQLFEAEAIMSEVGGPSDGGTAWNLWSNGELSATFQVDVAGEHELAVRAYGQQAGPDVARMGVTVNGIAIQEFAVSAERAAPGTYRARVSLAAGANRLAVGFLNDYYMPPADRNLIVDWMSVEGPFGVPPADTARWAELVPCDPAIDRRACLETAVGRFAGRAWRRPLEPEERARLLTLADEVLAEGGDFREQIGVVLHAILLSPSFVFRPEIDPDPTSLEPHALGEHELAARLSYFLWSSTPDDRLLDLAEAGALSSPETLRAEVARMLADPRSAELVENFVGQWLYTRALDDANPDYALYPDWDDAVKEALRDETFLVFNDFLATGRSLLDILDAEFTYANDRLAAHYGLARVGSDRMTRVALPPTPRRGLLGHGSFLTVTSHPKRTSPVKRGKFVLEQMLCTPPPPPPPGVEGLLDAQVDQSATLRERLEQHRRDPSCAVCHNFMDPIGLGLEHFDAIGAFRDADEAGRAIDASGTLPDGSSFASSLELAAILKADPRTPRCLTEKMFIYATGRGPVSSDRCALDAIGRDFAASGHSFEGLVNAIVRSDLFRVRRGEGGE